MAKNFYAVRNGRTPGIYKTWKECQSMVINFKGAEFKGFETEAEAIAYMENSDATEQSEALPEVYAFTDGSFNSATLVYGFGGFLHTDGQDIEIRGNGKDPDVVTSRNVAGEIHGALAAMKKAIELGLEEMTLFYDYEGVAKWAKGEWKTNKTISKYYVAEYEQIKESLSVKFIHVKAHTGIPGNELADRMAKAEAGIE